MEMLKNTFLKLYPKQPETNTGQLLAFSLMLIVVFGVLSFFRIGTLGILVVSLISSFIHATIAHNRPFRTGFLPPLLASVLLQVLYFVSATDIYPFFFSLVTIVLNLVPVALLSAMGAGFASWLLAQSKKKENEEQKKQKDDKSCFENNLKRLAIVTLFMYVTMHVLVPAVARVAAVEKQTVDEFLKEYDREKDYQPATEPIVPTPVGYGPVIGTNGGNSGSQENGKIPTWQEVQAKEAAAQKTKQQKKQQQTLAELKKKNLSYKELQQLAKQGKITGAQMIQLVNNGVSKGKISWWDAAKFYASGVGHAIQEVGNRIVKAVKPAVDWVVKHPLQSAAIAVAAVAVVAAAIFIPAVAAVAALAIAWGAVTLSYIGTAVTIGTGIYLGYSYLTGGTEGLKKAVFSQDTFSLLAKGDVFGAIGSGAVDVFNTVDSLIPVAAIVKLPGKIAQLPGLIGKIGKAIETVKEIKQIRLVITDSTGLLNGGGLATLKRAFMTAIEEGPEAALSLKTFAFGLVNDPQAVALLNKGGDGIETAKQLGSKNIAPIVEKKASEVLEMAKGKSGTSSNGNTVIQNGGKTGKVQNFTPFSPETYRKMPLNWEKVVKKGTGETRIQHVQLHEVNDLTKPLHGVFNGNAKTIIDEAWKSSSNAKITIESSTIEYIIPYKKAGWQGGYNGTGKPLDHVIIIVEKNTNNIISAYPY